MLIQAQELREGFLEEETTELGLNGGATFDRQEKHPTWRKQHRERNAWHCTEVLVRPEYRTGWGWAEAQLPCGLCQRVRMLLCGVTIAHPGAIVELHDDALCQPKRTAWKRQHMEKPSWQGLATTLGTTGAQSSADLTATTTTTTQHPQLHWVSLQRRGKEIHSTNNSACQAMYQTPDHGVAGR